MVFKVEGKTVVMEMFVKILGISMVEI